jgi:hypothetical protein
MALGRLQWDETLVIIGLIVTGDPEIDRSAVPPGCHFRFCCRVPGTGIDLCRSHVVSANELRDGRGDDFLRISEGLRRMVFLHRVDVGALSIRALLSGPAGCTFS